MSCIYGSDVSTNAVGGRLGSAGPTSSCISDIGCTKWQEEWAILPGLRRMPPEEKWPGGRMREIRTSGSTGAKETCITACMPVSYYHRHRPGQAKRHARGIAGFFSRAPRLNFNSVPTMTCALLQSLDSTRESTVRVDRWGQSVDALMIQMRRCVYREGPR